MIAPATSTLTAPVRSEPLPPERPDLREAAQAFEAIFVRRLLSAARASSLAEQTPFTGPGLEQFETMRDEHVADIAARNGGFGLAVQIERQLASMLAQQGSAR